MAIVSSYAETTVPREMVAFGELGLSGEVRGISRAADRLGEAAKLGFTKCLMPASNQRALRGRAPAGIEVIGVSSLREALRLILPSGRKERSTARVANEEN
jgi:DNA repair protein RadA/Sms